MSVRLIKAALKIRIANFQFILAIKDTTARPLQSQEPHVRVIGYIDVVLTTFGLRHIAARQAEDEVRTVVVSAKRDLHLVHLVGRVEDGLR